MPVGFNLNYSTGFISGWDQIQSLLFHFFFFLAVNIRYFDMFYGINPMGDNSQNNKYCNSTKLWCDFSKFSTCFLLTQDDIKAIRLKIINRSASYFLTILHFRKRNLVGPFENF